ncbi:MAG TPA: hypothetical protein PKC09_12070 [Paracoccus sp. (in: a-proteobacteria)]|uniref:hypothetical protein n=1 Tax=uncultured Paracoccus sp. TaxID=189685 RepID=UPI002622AB43|nr:hypothetical protein [uncultured Paracoccus sp.]HMQ41995.1 hypothetical protein [Paracoccus sp. (in: a-proteobacteria)]HMR35454.1 hypothetical protein [Paracoccus sp. (in: a-proteobacteria)]
MRLSDMFASLSRSAQDMEQRVAKWQDELGDKSEEMMASAKSWLASAQERDDELKEQVKTYLDDASEQVQAQWAKTQTDWDAGVAAVKEKAAEMRKKAETMQAEDAADWYEAYAANMVNYAQQMQESASNAVAAAAEKRAAAEAMKKA